MSFPACRHGKKPPPRAAVRVLTWLGEEPFRVFFLSGILFSIAGVALWPLFYAGLLGFYPGISHARVMIGCFGGAFVFGFLGTAGPRILAAPRLTPWELAGLFLLHLGSGVCHLLALTVWGDRLFLVLLMGFCAALGARLIFFRRNLPPPALLLAGTGLLCGLAGTALWLHPGSLSTASLHRLAGLLLYQGFLLGPIMGVGVFLFPRLLGGDFGEPAPGPATRRALLHTLLAAAALLLSFGVEVWADQRAGQWLRAVAFVLALAQVRWRRAPDAPPPGTLASALRVWCLPLALLGLIAPGFAYSRHVALDHLLFVGGFGLLCVIVASRVIFGHSGELPGFARKSWPARSIVFLIVLSALTRASADFKASIQLSHYQYAAWSWIIAAVAWLLWHARRFFQADRSAD